MMDQENPHFIQNGNQDNITEAIHGLDIFTKNYCMNVAETDKLKEPMFRCKECLFSSDGGKCLIKTFANDHESESHYNMSDFGSMGSL
jgi:hypothetical protein